MLKKLYNLIHLGRTNCQYYDFPNLLRTKDIYYQVCFSFLEQKNIAEKKRVETEK